MKLEKGITLVSLVVTIIILIILAGISMNTLIGDNGIISKTKQAKENMLLAQKEEEESLNRLYEQLDNMDTEIGKQESEAMGKLLEFKKIIANAITNEGVDTQEGDTAEIMAEHISKIVKEKTKDATATMKDINEGKTAWVNGEKVTGTMLNKASYSVTNLEGGYLFYYIPTSATKIEIKYTNNQYVIFNGEWLSGTSGNITKQLDPTKSYYFQIAGNGSSVSGNIYF
ncbi:MAG: hypothetical protein ACLU84_05365 [Clostridia bacterium]